MVIDKDLKPKPKQPLTCLERVCKVSHSQDKEKAFHKQLKFKTIQKLTNDHPERKISIKSEINPKIPPKIMSTHNIKIKHHTKNQGIWNSFGMENKLIKLDKQRCDTYCDTYIHMIIKQKPQHPYHASYKKSRHLEFICHGKFINQVEHHKV